MKHKILLGLTTTANSDWKDKVEEINKYNLSEIALFPTVLEKKDRLNLYRLLEKTDLELIPHVHARHDFDKNEYDYFLKRWKTKIFNIHYNEQFCGSLNQLCQYLNIIYTENTSELDNNFYKCLNKTAGLCLDFSHYYDYDILQNRKDYQNFEKVLKKYKIGCCHVSAISNKKIYFDYGGLDKWHFNRHTFKSLNQFDYLKSLRQYFPKYISIELENSFKEQLKVKKYINRLLKYPE